MKNITVFYLKIFSLLEVKFSIYLNRRVFVMKSADYDQMPHSHPYNLRHNHDENNCFRL